MQSGVGYATGLIDANAETVALDIRSHDSAAVAIDATSAVMTLQFEASNDEGTTWASCALVSLASTTTTTAVISVTNPTDNIYVLDPLRGAAVQRLRVRCSAYTSGSVTVRITAGTIAQGAA